LFAVTYYIELQWDQPFYSASGIVGSASDVDLLLVDTNNNVIKSSIDNNEGRDAIEAIQWTATYTGRHGISIVLKKGPSPGYMKWHSFNRVIQQVQYPVLSSAIWGHQNAVGAASVGAAAYDQTPRFGVSPAVQESFSGAGGTPIFFSKQGDRLSQPEDRRKPMFTGPDGGITTFFGGGNRFFGTSAAAPHVAAVGALMLDIDPSLTPQEMYDILRNTALDMDDTATTDFDVGYDTGTGYGFVNGLTAIDFVFANTPASTKQPTPAPTNRPTTRAPTRAPTPDPTKQPTTRAPTQAPTPAPTNRPTTRAPTRAPTPDPTKQPTTRAPSIAPTSAPDPPCTCFSSESTVVVFGKGTTPMRDVSVGDKILTGTSRTGQELFEVVYAFAHRDETRVAEFLKIHTTGVAKGEHFDFAPIDISEAHLLLVNDTFRPAKYIQVGDVLQGQGGDERIVTMIRKTHKMGLYAPVTTPSGTLLVNGIKVSSYVSIQKGLPDDVMLKIPGISSGMSQHQVVHLFLSPIRILCLGGVLAELCSTDNIDRDTGYPPFVSLGLGIAIFCDEQNGFVQFLLYIIFVVTFGSLHLVELLISSSRVTMFGALLIAATVLHYHKKRTFHDLDVYPPRCHLQSSNWFDDRR
jgi:Hint module/Subtilase family